MDREKLTRPKGHPLEIRTGHNPLELGLVWGTTLGVAPATVWAGARAESVHQVFPTPVLIAWYGLLLAWCALALIGIAPRAIHWLDDTTYPILRRRLNCERIGVFGVGGTFASFAFAALAAAGTHGLSSSGFLFGIAAGLFWRGAQIGVDLAKLTRAREKRSPPVTAVGDPDDPC